MNSIYKCLNGQHIDLSKIVSVEFAGSIEGARVYFQLVDGPIGIGNNYARSDWKTAMFVDEQKIYEDLLLAWKKFKREIDPETV